MSIIVVYMCLYTEYEFVVKFGLFHIVKEQVEC